MRVLTSMRTAMLLLVLALAATACASEEPTADDGGGEDVAVDDAPEGGDGGGAEGGLLQTIQDRGSIVCGVNNAVPGFGFVDEEGNFSGFDIEFCRVVAAAMFGDSEAVEFVPLTADERFTALQSGDIDVLIRNTTWTATRDGAEGATFLTTTFFDGQGMMVSSDSGVESLEDLQGATICVLSGTTTELNLASVSAGQGLDFNPQSFQDNSAIQAAFEQGQCDGWTSDKSQLAGIRSGWPEGPEALTILDVTISKEPLGPVVADGNQAWAEVVDWATIATMQAEEFGLTSENIGEADTSDPAIARFVGAEDPEEGTVFDPGLGLDPGFAVDVVEQVGNYAEIYERNVGPETGLGLERGFNALWTDGGLHYPPPYR